MRGQSLKKIFQKLMFSASVLVMTSCVSSATDQTIAPEELSEKINKDIKLFDKHMISDRAIEIETQIMNFHNQLAEEYGSSWGFMPQDIEAPYSHFIEILQTIQKTGNFQNLAAAFYSFETIYGKALETHIPEESISFYNYMEILDDKLQTFADNLDLPPPNILSHERREYETEKAIKRQLPTFEISAYRNLMQRFRTHFISFAPKPEQNTIAQYGNEKNPYEITMPNIMDILKWPQETFTDEQISNINIEILETMATSIDGEYISYKIAKAAAKQELEKEVQKLRERFEDGVPRPSKQEPKYNI